MAKVDGESEDEAETEAGGDRAVNTMETMQ